MLQFYLRLGSDIGLGDETLVVGPFESQSDRSSFIHAFWQALENLNRRLALKDPADTPEDREMMIDAYLIPFQTSNMIPQATRKGWTPLQYMDLISTRRLRRFAEVEASES